MDLRILEELGLSTAEAKIYVALLELGQAKTGKIIDKTKLQSSTVYHILGSLLEKGLISYIMKGKMKWYQAENPDSLLSFLDDKKRKLRTILPELRKKEQMSRIKQHAKVFEGIKGLQAAYNDILTTMKRGEEYFFFQFPKHKLNNKQLELFFRNYHLKHAERGIKVKGLAPFGSRSFMKKIYTLPHTKIRFMNEPAPTVVVIYKNKVITIDWDDRPVAFVMQSAAVAKSYAEFFKQKWKQAEE